MYTMVGNRFSLKWEVVLDKLSDVENLADITAFEALSGDQLEHSQA